MTNANSGTPILEKDHYTGEITVNGVRAPIGFSLSAGTDCRLVFETDPVEAQTYLLVQKDSGRPGQTVAQFSLNARSVNGKTVASESVYLGPSGSNKVGFFLGLNAGIVALPLAKPVEMPVLRLWFRSFRSFHNPIVETRLGKARRSG